MRSTRLACLLFFLAAGAARAEEFARLEQRLVGVARRSRTATVGIVGLIGMGSGAVIDAEGLVLTNAHVAAGAPWAVVVFADGRRLLARRVGIHFARDLALLRLPAGKYDAFGFGPRPAKGEWVVALGHPGGVKPDSLPSVSAGQVTGPVKGVQVYGVLDYSGGIETDVAIYSGNSGGPLVDLEGRLVGINGAMNPVSGAAFSLSPEIIGEVLPALRAGGITLRPGLRLDTERGPLRGIFELYQKLVERAMKQRLSPTPGLRLPVDPARIEALRRRLAGELVAPAKRIWERRHSAARQQRMLTQLAGPLAPARGAAIELLDAQGRTVGLATVIAKGFAVAPLDLVRGERIELRQGQRRRAARVLRADREGGLVLLDAGDLGAPLAAAAPGQPGSLLLCAAPARGLAAGVLSVRRRAVQSGAARMLAQLGQQELLDRLVRLLQRAPSWLGLRELARVLEQQRRRTRIMELGSLPRAYPEVFQHDSPVHPGRMGGPVVDRQGRWVGINVARAHHGTTYAVAAQRVLRVFAAELRR